MDPSYSFPPDHVMCHEDECRQRQSRHEISEWEATCDTYQLKTHDRILDARLAVQKYRRSAAGHGAYQQTPPRKLPALRQTLQHLFYLLQIQAPVHCNTASHKKKSLISTVAFVDDRIRAIQVDLVRQEAACGTIQAQLVRYHVLLLYLLSDVPTATFEPKFARKALWTAVSAYWNDPTQNSNEVMCYACLCRVASLLRRAESALPINNSGTESLDTGYSGVLQEYDKMYTSISSDLLFALEIASAAHGGYYRNVLSMLSKGDTSFHVLCRCCMAPALNVLRIGALRQYNKCFGKGEKISGKEMARLLYLPSAQAALDFCQSVGLPLHESHAVIMKVAPISITDPAVISKMQSASRTDDDFVFGKSFENWRTEARMDEDNVLIPTGKLLAEWIGF